MLPFSLFGLYLPKSLLKLMNRSIHTTQHVVAGLGRHKNPAPLRPRYDFHFNLLIRTPLTLNYNIYLIDTAIIPRQSARLLLRINPKRFCYFDMFPCNRKKQIPSP
jgi:hypothetical protein